MKKIALLAASIFVLTACGSPTAQDAVSGELGVDASSAEVLSQTDDHGGFHGDGTTVIVLDCGDTDIAGQIGGMEGWKPFPLDDTVKALVYGVEDGTVKMGPYLSDEAGEPLVPEIEEGYYLLIDRQAEEGKATGADILHRASFNFTKFRWLTSCSDKHKIRKTRMKGVQGMRWFPFECWTFLGQP